MARCWPSEPPVWDAGSPLCSQNAIRIDEGRKSFPSGACSMPPPLSRCSTKCGQGHTCWSEDFYAAHRIGHSDHASAKGQASCCGPCRIQTCLSPVPAVSGVVWSLKSLVFRTGHSSWTTSGLGYLSFWLAGKLRCFDGQGHPWRLVVSFTPSLLALWIGLTRLQVSIKYADAMLYTHITGGSVLTLQLCLGLMCSWHHRAGLLASLGRCLGGVHLRREYGVRILQVRPSAAACTCAAVAFQ